MKRTLLLTTASGLSLWAPLAQAVPTPIVHVETPECDPLFIPQLVDEIGFSPPFPIDERLEATATFTNQPACPMTDNPNIPNALVVMTNLTAPPRAFREVWYVKDQETVFSNIDGLAASPGLPLQHTFKIDTVGVNRPLVFESFVFDGIWAPGETWHFIIQDYGNGLGLPPFLYDSIGVPSIVSPPSSGSIIAIEIPEPGTLLAAAPLSALLACRRRR
jgi:hypothetical protein